MSKDQFEPVDVFDGEEDLRPGSDDCYKCSACDLSCPVAEVDDEFPGPKFQGPEQWRLKRKGDVDVDPSIADCSNCMRCDSACPSGVPLSEMHNRARSIYVDEHLPRYTRKFWRNKLLANYGRLAGVASRVPRLATAVANSRPVRWLNERLLGIASEREFPAFATETFREWWDHRGGEAASRERARANRNASAPQGDDGPGPEADDRKVAYFHGDYANYNTPEVAKALVRVFEHFGYEVAVPEQRCSGTPMFANGMLEDARAAARVNVANLDDLVAEGYEVVCSCTSCSMALRTEYPELFGFEALDDPDRDPADAVERVAAHTYEAVEFLRVHEDLASALSDTAVDMPDLTYHAPCHARNQGIAGQPLELFADLDGVETHDAGESCSGISGTYGWKADNYETSMAIGAEMFAEMEAADAEAGLTECPTCAMQMEHGTGYDVYHPLVVLEEALGDESA